MLTDIKQAARGLLKSRGFAGTAVLTLALGIGANAAAVSAAWHLLLKPLPWPGAERLVQIWNTAGRTGAINVIAPANYLDFEREARSFEALAAFTFFEYSLNLAGAGEPLEARVCAVTGEYFDVFGVGAERGRTLGRADAENNEAVLVISDGLWRRQFGAAPDIPRWSSGPSCSSSAWRTCSA